MNWLFFTAIAVVARAIYGIMTKVLSNKLDVSAYTKGFLLPLAGMFISLLAAPFLGGIHFTGNVDVTTVLLVVVSQGLGNIFYFAALKDLTNSTAQIAFSSVLVFNTVLAMTFLNLHLSFINFVGIILLLLAIISVTTGKIELHRRGVMLMIVAAFIFAIFQLSSGELSKQVTAATYLVTAYGGAALTVLIVKFRQVVGDLKKVTDKAVIIKIPLLTAIPSVLNSCLRTMPTSTLQNQRGLPCY